MVKNIDLERRIGALVRLKRLSVGLTQEDVGERIGVSYQQVQKYETGVNRVAVSTLVRIAQALGTTATDLVAEIEGN